MFSNIVHAGVRRCSVGSHTAGKSKASRPKGPGCFTHFIDEGWQGGAQADAALKAEDKGASIATAIDVAPGIRLYQLTESGIALQATVQGTKYWKDDELN